MSDGAGHDPNGEHGSTSDSSNEIDDRSAASGDTAQTHDDRQTAAHADHHDPVHTFESSGDGWHRIEDKPDNPHYGEPLERHWDSGDYPTPTDATRSTFDLIEHPDEPWGHHSNGEPLTQAEYDERYNQIGPEGQHWENYPPNDGAVPGTRVLYESGEAYLRDYGPYLDRIGLNDGSYLGVMPDGVPPAFEERGLPVSSLNSPYGTFSLNSLPDGYSIEVSEIAPAFGRDGGALQVLIYDDAGRKRSVAQLLKDGVLE